MQLRKRLMALCFIMLFLCSWGYTAYAHEVPDLSKKGSILVTMTYDGKTVPGGTLTLYPVGAIKEDDGNYSFALTGDFVGSGADLSDCSSDRLAKELANYAGTKKLPGTMGTIGKDGVVSFSNLTLGLYLLVQEDAADGYNKVDPFLVSVPMNENGAYIYEVNASPKVEVTKDTRVSPTPTTSAPKTPEVSKDAILPQTGQLNWPIPVLVILGLGLFSIGWLLRFGRRGDCHEK